MADNGDIVQRFGCDCGHEFDISLVGKEPETMQFTCPGCGKVQGFDLEQARQVRAQYEATKRAIEKAFKR